MVVRHLVAHHGGSVHGKRLVDLWWSDSYLLIMERHALSKTGGPVLFRQLDAHHGGGVDGQKLVDMW